MNRATVAEFDHAAFREDVLDYIGRQRMPKCELAAKAGIGGNTVLTYLAAKERCDLTSAAALAFVCDLDLGDYVRAVAS